jgi:hypothetical protein
LASIWAVSDDFVRRLFLHEPGVVVFCKHRPGKGVYRVIRVPESVARRVHRRMERDLGAASQERVRDLVLQAYAEEESATCRARERTGLAGGVR